MPVILALNPGSNSLKFDIVDVASRQRVASAGTKLLSGSIDDIGKRTRLELVRNGRVVASESGDFRTFGRATQHLLRMLSSGKVAGIPTARDLEMVAVRVVHGGSRFKTAVRLDAQVRREIESRKELAPLHNQSSLQIIDAVQSSSSKLSIWMAFDTAFHHTLPEVAWRYAIPKTLADRYGIRKFGFHGLSHRYLLERYAQLANKPVRQCSVVTLHLEGGSSAAAIRKGKSIDTSMGFTPLEGLMMGTRCGSIDAAILPYLSRHSGMTLRALMEVLEEKSGLLGISGRTQDTRILRKKKDRWAKLAIAMFAYRARLQVGAYAAAVGKTVAVIFGGGIGENTPEVRGPICEGLQNHGLDIDPRLQARTRSGDVKISRARSKVDAWVIHSEESLQLAHECVQAQRSAARR